MSDERNGGSAFPWHEVTPDGDLYHQHGGMTLRDYFAGQVLGMCAHDICEGEDVARRCYAIADAMLKAREAKGDE